MSRIQELGTNKSLEHFSEFLFRAPKANEYCERLIGSPLRERLDWCIPLNQRPVRILAREWPRGILGIEADTIGS